MTDWNKLIDDLLKAYNEEGGALQDVRLDLITNEEYDAVCQVAVERRAALVAAITQLEERIASFERQLNIAERIAGGSQNAAETIETMADKVFQLRERIATLEEGQRWTSFRAGVPNREDWFLFHFENGDIRSGKFDHIFEDGTAAVIVYQKYGGAAYTRFDATHWRPLPPAP